MREGCVCKNLLAPHLLHEKMCEDLTYRYARVTEGNVPLVLNSVRVDCIKTAVGNHGVLSIVEKEGGGKLLCYSACGCAEVALKSRGVGR